MKCPNCNQEIPDGAAFCPFCGGKTSIPAGKTLADDIDPVLPETDPIEQGTDRISSETQGVGSDTGWRYTGRMTDEVNGWDDQGPILPPVREKKKTNMLPIIVIAVSCIVIVLSVIFIFFNGKHILGGKDNESKDPSASSAETVSVTPEVTETPPQEATESPTPTLTPDPTATPIPTATPTPLPTATPTPLPTATPTPVPAVVIPDVITIYGGIQANAADFLFPESSSEYLTTERMNQVMESSDSNLMHKLSQLAINEILARYGFRFTSSSQTAQDARDQFEDKGWYQSVRQICPSNQWDVLRSNYMNSYERSNFDALNQWQKDHGVYY